MRLLEVTRSEQRGWVRLGGLIERGGGETVELYYEFPEQWGRFVFDGADPFVAAMVLPHMMIESPPEDLYIDPPVSNQIIRGAHSYMDAASVMRAQEMQRIAIHAKNLVDREGTVQPTVGAFFSMGVDSFYTLLKSVRDVPSTSPRITHLINIAGVQEPLSRERGIEDTRLLMREVAKEVDLPILFGRTNLRDVFDAKWGRYHGAGLASVALALSAGFGRILLPSAHAYSNFRSIGCHPLLDQWWSNELTRVTVDGAERIRRDKLLHLVGNDPLGLKYLRVCLHNRGAEYNCGRCQKCLRTMLTLHLMGTLNRAESFPGPFTSQKLDLMAVRTYSEMVHVQEILDYAREIGANPRLIRRLHKLVRRFQIREAVETIAADSPLQSLLAAHDSTRKAWRKLRAKIPMPRRPVLMDVSNDKAKSKRAEQSDLVESR